VNLNKQSSNWFPLRHQPLVAILLAAGMLGSIAYFLRFRVELGPLVDVDHLSKQTACYRVDLNTAPWPELVVLPGIGEKLARSLVEHRTRIGAFRSHDEILDVHGIGESKLALLKAYLLPILNSD
jgi:competence ComEA-like helix-hairpin-helix protein